MGDDDKMKKYIEIVKKAQKDIFRKNKKRSKQNMDNGQIVEPEEKLSDYDQTPKKQKVGI